MKKTPLFLIALSALTFAACTEDEPVSVRKSNEAISFRSGMATRATETNNANLSDIYVTAFETNEANTNDSILFENTLFSKGSDSFFTSAKNYYWPQTDNVNFFAYAPSQDELRKASLADFEDMEDEGDEEETSEEGEETEGAYIDSNSGNMKLVNFYVAKEIANQIDFITAKASGNKKENTTNGVMLDFYHRLSQIEIQAKSENPDYTFEVTGARIGRAEYIATYDFNNNEWTLDDWHKTEIYDTSIDPVILTADPVSLMGNAGNAMMIPQTLTPWDPIADTDNVARDAYLSVLVKITKTESKEVVYPFPTDNVKDESGNLRQYAWASIPLSGKWEQGKKYIYTLDFTYGAGNVDPDDPTPGDPVLAPIKLKVNVIDWENNDSSMPMNPILKTK